MYEIKTKANQVIYFNHLMPVQVPKTYLMDLNNLKERFANVIYALSI